MPQKIPKTPEDNDLEVVKKHLRLLWAGHDEKPVRPGPRPRITVDDVVGTAIERAGSAGLSGLTMRDLAADLGVKTMTLYAHVPDKGSLLALMSDHVFDSSARSLPHSGAWRDRVGAVIDDTFQMYLSHDWLSSIHTEQPVLGPGFLGRYERQLECLQGLGLSDITLDATLTFLNNFARTAALDVADRETLNNSGPDWWQAAGPVLEELVSPNDYPLATRVGTSAGQAQGGAYNARSNYAFGVDRVLDGLAVLVDRALP